MDKKGKFSRFLRKVCKKVKATVCELGKDIKHALSTKEGVCTFVGFLVDVLLIFASATGMYTLMSFMACKSVVDLTSFTQEEVSQ